MNNKNKGSYRDRQFLVSLMRKVALHYSSVFISMTLLLGTSFFSTPVLAGLVLPDDVVLQGGGVTITETAASDLFGFGQYSVQNGSSNSIFAIAVSNNHTVQVDTQFATASDSATINWNSQIVNSASWNSTNIFNEFGDPVALSTFGVFTDFFLVTDSVNLYFVPEFIVPVVDNVSAIYSMSNIINPGASVSQAFFFSPELPDSSGVVFTPNGAITVSSAVPVPAAFWLLGSGLIGLIGYKRNGI